MASDIYIYWYLFIEGKGGRFSGGFDINVFEKIHRTGTS
jgi:hypothetical protein